MKLNFPFSSVEEISTSVVERVTCKTECRNYVFKQLDIPELLHGFTVAAAAVFRTPRTGRLPIPIVSITESDLLSPASLKVGYG